MKAKAKYLPVETNKSPDFRVEDGAVPGDIVYENKKTPYLVRKDMRLVPVKLFAVTQEGPIKSGDDVWDELRKWRFKCSEKLQANGEIYFKILGELSPNATWEIKDGQEIEVAEEFIEEGISYFYEDLDCKLHGIEKELAVKGPCGHYH